MIVVDEESWSWMLFKEDDRHYFSVVCGSVGLFTCDIELSASETAEYSAHGKIFLSRLSSAIRSNPAKFSSRHISDFDKRQGVKEAIQHWRLNQSQNS